MANGPATNAQHGPMANGPTTGAPHGPAMNGPHGPTTNAPHGPAPGAQNFGHPNTNFGHPNNTNAGGFRAGPGGGPSGGFRGPNSSHAFVGHPTPAGAHEMHTANGSVIRTRPDGTRADFHDARRGMEIHHGLDGNRRIVVERADHSRIFVERGGHGYVQHPYYFHGHEFAQRTYFVGGHPYARYYGRYPYHGVYLEVYAPVHYYPVGFYGWAYRPWVTPVTFGWGWGGAPWYGYYGFYFAPYPVYASPAFWLTDYLIATSLQASYAAQVQANAQAAAAAANGPPALSPDVKQQIADEVKYDVQQENLAAQANASNPQGAPADMGIAAILSDGRPHVFVAGSDLDVVDSSGRECRVSQGDVMQVQSAPPPDAVQADAIMLASKGGNECTRSARVTVALTDLQEMQNHMRETIDQGMAEMQAKQGKEGLPAVPAADRGPPVDASFAAGAPPPDANAGAEITAQAKAADQAEMEDVNAVAAAGAGGAGSGGPPPTIALGQTPDQVTASFGQPTRIVDLGAKQIYTYPDMKVIFKDGKVSDVQ